MTMTDSNTEKSESAYRTISEVAEALDVQPHVLRFWETKFTKVKPLKRAGGRRYYSQDDVELLFRIRRLLYNEGYTIKGVQKLMKKRFVDDVAIEEQDNSTASQKLSPTQLSMVPEPEMLPEVVKDEIQGIIDDLKTSKAKFLSTAS